MTSLIRRICEKFRSDGVIQLTVSGIRFIRYKISTHLERYVYPYNLIKHRYKYGAAAPDRDRLLYIDPNEVDCLLAPHFWSRVSRYATHVRSGDWDRRYADERVVLSGEYEGMSQPALVPFENYQLYQSVKKRFQDGVPWEHTKLFETLVDSPHRYWSAYRRPDQIKYTLQNIDELRRQIERHGYLTQRECAEQNGPRIKTNMTRLPPALHEVALNIGRNGELIFDDGRHRFVVARALGIDQIPVRVLVRHQQWQELRQEIAEADSREELSDRAIRHLGHPDLADVTTRIDPTES